MEILIDRKYLLNSFLRYVKIDTVSNAKSRKMPSSKGQVKLAAILEQELKQLGLETSITKNGYVLSEIPANSHSKSPVIAFIAHMDCSDACSGKVKPLVHKNYNGEAIRLPSGIILDPASDNELAERKGDCIISSSGDSLLGGDDKSGIAVIMGAVKYLVENPEIPHGRIRICFTPDEEIARGTDGISIPEIGADYAYTIDSEGCGCVEYETFSADVAEVTFEGISTHPGSAKDKMVNAVRAAATFIGMLPLSISPERTSGREGFLHPIEIAGNPAKIVLDVIIRDFEISGLKEKAEFIHKIAAETAAEHPGARISVHVSQQYRNMRYWLDKDMTPVNHALKAVKEAGLTAISLPVRGGTDGSRLTEKGLLTPNLSNGSHNPHSVNEWASLDEMQKSSEILVRIAKSYAK